MKKISVRELREHVGVWLRRAEAGETLEITSRGRPVAILAPLPTAGNALAALASDGDPFEQLIAAGRVIPAKHDLLAHWPPPLDPRPDLPLPSKVLEDMRADER